MIKTNYLTYHLTEIVKTPSHWCAVYYHDSAWWRLPIAGKGHSIEAAVADAQRKIQLAERE